MKSMAAKISTSLAILLLTSFFPISASSAPVTANSTRQGEASTGWQGLLPVIETFLQTIRSGDIEKAYYNFTTKELQARTSLAQFTHFTEELAVFKSNKLFSFLSFYFDNGVAIFQGTLISTHGDSMQTEFDLKPEGTDWKIDGINLFKPEMITPPQDSKSNSTEEVSMTTKETKSQTIRPLQTDIQQDASTPPPADGTTRIDRP